VIPGFLVVIIVLQLDLQDMPPPLMLDGATVERVLSYLAFTYPMISSGHNTLMPSRPQQHPDCIYLNNSDALVHHTKTCCASTVQFCARYLNMKAQFGTELYIGTD